MILNSNNQLPQNNKNIFQTFQTSPQHFKTHHVNSQSINQRQFNQIEETSLHQDFDNSRQQTYENTLEESIQTNQEFYNHQILNNHQKNKSSIKNIHNLQNFNKQHKKNKPSLCANPFQQKNSKIIENEEELYSQEHLNTDENFENEFIAQQYNQFRQSLDQWNQSHNIEKQEFSMREAIQVLFEQVKLEQMQKQKLLRKLKKNEMTIEKFRNFNRELCSTLESTQKLMMEERKKYENIQNEFKVLQQKYERALKELENRNFKLIPKNNKHENKENFNHINNPDWSEDKDIKRWKHTLTKTKLLTEFDEQTDPILENLTNLLKIDQNSIISSVKQLLDFKEDMIKKIQTLQIICEVENCEDLAQSIKQISNQLTQYKQMHQQQVSILSTIKTLTHNY